MHGEVKEWRYADDALHRHTYRWQEVRFEVSFWDSRLLTSHTTHPTRHWYFSNSSSQLIISRRISLNLLCVEKLFCARCCCCCVNAENKRRQWRRHFASINYAYVALHELCDFIIRLKYIIGCISEESVPIIEQRSSAVRTRRRFITLNRKIYLILRWCLLLWSFF